MGNSLRCCLACVLPFGALDVIRIVHLSGYVEELTRPITAGEILKANPDHVLSKPSSQGGVRRIMILLPESDLKRGSIYFLIPASSFPEKKNNNTKSSNNNNNMDNKNSSRKSKKCISNNNGPADHCNRYLEEVISPKKSTTRKDRQSGRVGVWRPYLHSISEY